MKSTISFLLFSFIFLFNLNSIAQEIASLKILYENGSDAHQDTIIFFGDTLKLCPASFDSSGNFIEYVQASWNIFYFFDNLPKKQSQPEGCIDFIFSIDIPTNFIIVAGYNNFTDTSGVIIVQEPVPNAPDYIQIRTAPDGGGSELNTFTMIAGDSLMLYAAGYDTAGNYIGDQIAKWTTTGSLDRMEDDSTNMFIFSPEKCQPSSFGTIIATVGAISDTTGIISVMGWGLCKIIIRDAPHGGGNEVTDFSMTTDQEINLYAAGYDESDNYMFDLTTKWTTTGSLDAIREDGTSEFIFSPSTAPTSGTIIATSDDLNDATGTITVNPGELCLFEIRGRSCDLIVTIPPNDDVCIPEYEDTTSAYVGDHLPLWASGYDCEGNYIGDRFIQWDSISIDFTGTLFFETPSGNGASIILELTQPGQGRVVLNDTDTSGVIIVTENPASTTTNHTIPSQFKLEQAYPNPFNPSTTIRFYIPKSEHVKLEIYNNIGQIVETLIDWRMTAGEHIVEFNAGYLSSGIYPYRIEADEFQDVKKMILIK
jgi:hypothetical protein